MILGILLAVLVLVGKLLVVGKCLYDDLHNRLEIISAGGPNGDFHVVAVATAVAGHGEQIEYQD